MFSPQNDLPRSPFPTEALIGKPAFSSLSPPALALPRTRRHSGFQQEATAFSWLLSLPWSPAGSEGFLEECMSGIHLVVFLNE